MDSDIVHDPIEIYRRSFAIIRAEICLSGLSPLMEKLIVRIIHATGMVELAHMIRFSDGAAEHGKAALAKGSNIIVDTEMVAMGIIRNRLPKQNNIICTLNEAGVASAARAKSITRTSAAVELWSDHLERSLVVIGNAPTALFSLLELMKQGTPKPSLVIGLPVGFVGASESKDLLLKNPFKIPYITLPGRLGGSGMAAAAINALGEDRE